MQRKHSPPAALHRAAAEGGAAESLRGAAKGVEVRVLGLAVGRLVEPCGQEFLCLHNGDNNLRAEER